MKKKNSAYFDVGPWGGKRHYVEYGKLVAFLRENPGLTATEIAKEIRASVRQVQRKLISLENYGKLYTAHHEVRGQTFHWFAGKARIRKK